MDGSTTKKTMPAIISLGRLPPRDAFFKAFRLVGDVRILQNARSTRGFAVKAKQKHEGGTHRFCKLSSFPRVSNLSHQRSKLVGILYYFPYISEVGPRSDCAYHHLLGFLGPNAAFSCFLAAMLCYPSSRSARAFSM